MLSKLRCRLTFANVVSMIALFVALGGVGAYATHETIFSSDIVDGEVKAVDLGTSAVTAPKIANFAVTSAKLAPNSVKTGKVLDNNLQGADLLDGTVATADLADGAVTPAKLGTIPAARVQRSFGQGVDNGSASALEFDTESFDTAGLHDNVTPTRLTAPISGVYQISAGVRWNTDPQGERELVLHRGCVPFADSVIGPSGPTGQSAQSVSDLLKLSAGEFVEAVVFQSSGDQLITFAGERVFLAMTWVGPG